MYIFKLRRDTSTMWTTKNPILAEGEPGFETDTGRLKIGNDRTFWNDLPYFIPGSSSGGVVPLELAAHIDHLTPHPVYDDGPSLNLLYENAKV